MSDCFYYQTIWEIEVKISILTVRLCDSFIIVSGGVKILWPKIVFYRPVPLLADWSVNERQEAVTMHVA